MSQVVVLEAIKQVFFEQTVGEIEPASIQDFTILHDTISQAWYLHAVPMQEWFAEVHHCAGAYAVVLHNYREWEELANV